MHQLNNEIKNILQEKHPKGREASPEVLLPSRASSPESVIFEAITAETVYKTAKQMKGSGGPTLIDSDMWKQFLCSKAYGNTTTGLCQAVPDLTKILCLEEINPDCLQEFIAGRLVPLDKKVT